MMKTKHLLALALSAMLTLPMTAQDKLFTLEDLIYGGANFH